MIFWRIVFYLLQFYLFAAGATLSYLTVRAVLNPAATRRKSGMRRDSNAIQVLRAAAFGVLGVAGLIGAISEGASGIHLDATSIVRLAAYVIVVASLPKDLRLSWKSIFAYTLLIAGEILRARAAPLIGNHHIGLPIVASVCLASGMTMLGLAIKGALIRVRIVNRLVIAFAIFSMLLAQLVVVIFLGLVFSIGLGITSQQMQDIIDHADIPVLITLSGVLVTSAVIGFFLLARDISAPMTRVERALRAIGEGELDYRVQLKGNRDDEMHDLAREVNRMAQRLKDAEAVRAEFFSFVSHELRSPLTSIRGFVQTLQQAPDFSDNDREEIYAIIHDESDRLLRMIGELLDVARIEAGRPITVNKQRFDANRHVEKVVEIMRAHTQRHELVVTRPQAPVWIEADPDKFDQILINLLSNAIKYSPDGGQIDIGVAESEQTIAIAVKDPGVGMTAEQAAHVFDKFYRVSDQETRPSRLARVEGAGIGLYLTRALVESHGGQIGVESRAGVGSTFTVILPRVTVEQNPAQIETPPENWQHDAILKQTLDLAGKS